MIANALTRMPLRTPAEALADALAAAHKRFVIGGRVVHMDGFRRGTLRDIVVDGGVVRLVIVTDENQVVRELPGFWSRSSL